MRTGTLPVECVSSVWWRTATVSVGAVVGAASAAVGMGAVVAAASGLKKKESMFVCVHERRESIFGS